MSQNNASATAAFDGLYFYIYNMETLLTTQIAPNFSKIVANLQKGKRFGILHGRSKKPIAMLVPFVESEEDKSSYEIGKNYFGKYGSGNRSLSKDYKKTLKRKLHEKYNSR